MERNSGQAKVQQRNLKGPRFPEKLHVILDAAHKHKYTHVVSWMPDGKSFRVHEKEVFSSHILPEHFGTSKYKSFQRNLNLWGFKTSERSECYHPLFVRGKPELCKAMVRENKGTLDNKANDSKVSSPAAHSVASSTQPSVGNLRSPLPPPPKLPTAIAEQNTPRSLNQERGQFGHTGGLLGQVVGNSKYSPTFSPLLGFSLPLSAWGVITSATELLQPLSSSAAALRALPPSAPFLFRNPQRTHYTMATAGNPRILNSGNELLSFGLGSNIKSYQQNNVSLAATSAAAARAPPGTAIALLDNLSQALYAQELYNKSFLTKERGI